MRNYLARIDELLANQRKKLINDRDEKVLGEANKVENDATEPTKFVKQEDPIRNFRNGYKDYSEESFYSIKDEGADSLVRWYQALHYPERNKNPAYGMECNAVTMMYFLQNIGLIPNFMMRKEFEYAFTLLHPYQNVYNKNNPITIAGNNLISINGDNALPINLISESILTISALLGGSGGISLVKQSLPQAINKLETICRKFAELPYKYDAYKSMADEHKTITKEFIVDNQGTVKNGFIYDFSYELGNGLIGNDYFVKGGCIYVSVDYHQPYDGNTGHYVVIVDNYTKSFVYKNNTYFIYPADDSLWGQVYVICPPFEGNPDVFNDVDINNYYYKGKQLHSMAKAIFSLGIQ